MIGTNKFKVGDKIIILPSAKIYATTAPGSEGTIVEVKSDRLVQISFYKITGTGSLPCTFDIFIKDVGHLTKDWDD